MAQANFSAGNFGNTVRDSVKMKTSIRVVIEVKNVAGCLSPTFIVKGLGEDTDDLMAAIGMTGGGQAIKAARERFSRYLKLLIEIATLQTQFVTIERVIKVTNRRVNALEFVVIPRILATIAWIESELDEIEREDFYRLKCVTDKKKQAKIQEAKEAAEKLAKLQPADGAVKEVDEQADIFEAYGADDFEEEEVDEDILF